MRAFVQHEDTRTPALFIPPQFDGTENSQPQSSPISEMAFGSLREPQAAVCTATLGVGGGPPGIRKGFALRASVMPPLLSYVLLTWL